MSAGHITPEIIPACIANDLRNVAIASGHVPDAGVRRAAKNSWTLLNGMNPLQQGFVSVGSSIKDFVSFFCCVEKGGDKFDPFGSSQGTVLKPVAIVNYRNSIFFTFKGNHIGNNLLAVSIKIFDEFFQSFDVEAGAGVEVFREEIKGNMQRELDAKLRATAKSAVFEAIQKANELELPKPLIDREIDVLKQQSIQQFSQGRDANIDIPDLPGSLFEEQAKI